MPYYAAFSHTLFSAKIEFKPIYASRPKMIKKIIIHAADTPADMYIGVAMRKIDMPPFVMEWP